MAVGKAGGRKGAGGARGASGAGAAKGSFGRKVDKSESLVGPSGAAGSSNVGGPAGAGAADPVTAQAMQIVAQLKSGEIKTRSEATRALVKDILRQKVRMQSKALTEKISEELEGDPRVNQALERLWGGAGGGGGGGGRKGSGDDKSEHGAEE